MITTEAYFDNINTEISKELDLATQSIYVAVVWFTDKGLFAKLLEKQTEGCKVYLIINDDQINSSSKLDHKEIEKLGGFFKYISGELMHNKFCIIDKKVVITGSYNWTNNAAYHNKENITITQGDFDLSIQFIDQFDTLAGLKEASPLNIDYGKLIKRLRIIIELIGLGDEEDIEYQCKRLQKEDLDHDLLMIVDLVENKQFEKALSTIEKYISSKSTIEAYIDPRISALKLDIKNLEFRIVSIDDQFADATREVHEFNTEYYRVLGELIEKIYKIKTIYFETHKNDDEDAKAEYQQNKKDQEEFHEDKTAIEEDPSISLNETQKKELKKMHREAAMLCHPDKVSDELKDQATAMFQDLQDAYEKQDINRVADILSNVKSGNWARSEAKLDMDILKKRKQHLEDSLNKKLKDLEELLQSASYIEIHNLESLEVYLNKSKEDLEIEYNYWIEKK